MILIRKLLAGERYLHRENVHELFFAAFIIIILNDVDNSVPYDIGDIHTDTFTHQGVTTFLIDDGTLYVHHNIIFNQSFTNTEVILFHLLLCTFDALGNHRVLNHFAFLEAQTVHNTGNTLRGKQTHQLIFQRNIEHRTTWVTLTTGTTTQLAVHTAAFMTLSTDDGKTTSILYILG